MILSVNIENLVIVEQASFTPGPGLTTVTGETGAGKTLLATAIALLFGGDADAALVGASGDDAWVEGEFEVADSFWHHPDVAALCELRPDSETPLVLARKVSRSGRSRALAWGRTITRTDLAAAGRLLLATAGQHAGRRLLAASYQRDQIDAAGDDRHQALRARVVDAWQELEHARSELDRIAHECTQISERAEHVRDDISLIRAVGPSTDDEAQLVAQRTVARNGASLAAALDRAHHMIAADGASAIDLVGGAASAATEAALIDTSLADVADALHDVQSQLVDHASRLSARRHELSESSHAIDDIEERLSAYDDLKRRFGGTTESVIARLAQLETDLELIDSGDEVLARARDRHAAAENALHAVCEQLSASRCAVADTIAAQVTDALRELGMSDSVFRIEVTDAPASRSGSDRVQLMLAPSQRLEPRPIGEVASGGELSRIALALHLATGSGEAPTMVFDEIDAGIGGHTAHAIASMLKRLAQSAQVICITHLPQVAARADTHVVIAKTAGATSLTTLSDEEAVISELCRMLGSDESDEAARSHARELRGPRFIASRDTCAR